MKRKAFALTFLVLSIAGALLVGSVMGDDGIVYFPSVPQIIINADGAITPQTGQISRSGSTYTLTENLNGTQVVIECSNIIFDGNDHSIDLTGSAFNAGIHVSNSINTTIKNLEVFTSFTAIAMYNCSYCRVTGIDSNSTIDLRGSSYNIISENTSPIYVKYQAEYNQFYRNNIKGHLSLFSGSNMIFANNISLDINYPLYVAEGNFWDNGSVGNYWSDYLTRYPNASEIGQTGVGDTPYEINADNVDYHPFMHPYIEKGTIVFPNQEAEPDTFPAAPVAVASVAAAVTMGVALLVYFKKRKH